MLFAEFARASPIPPESWLANVAAVVTLVRVEMMFWVTTMFTLFTTLVAISSHGDEEFADEIVLIQFVKVPF